MLLKDQIVRHYDELSSFYRDLWGVHIHYGYWRTGKEAKEEAQPQLILELIARADVRRASRVLDVGCGLGGSAIFLSKALGARRWGYLSTSANRYRQRSDRFDLVWSVEALSHLSKKEDCVHAIAGLLNHEGKLVIADWFKSGTATAAQARVFLEPIERAMLVPKLEVPSSYASYIRDAGLRVLSFDDLSEKVRKTWDLAIELIRAPTLWKLAARRGEDFLAFLQAFAAMRAGYQSKALSYGALIAQKP